MNKKKLKTALCLLLFLLAGILYFSDRGKDRFSEELASAQTTAVSSESETDGIVDGADSHEGDQTADDESNAGENLTGQTQAAGGSNTEETVASAQGSVSSVKSVTESDENTSFTKTIRVHVCGAVKYAGVYTLAEGSIVEDAVKAAGGSTSDAAADYLNLAKTVTDGEKIYVPFLKDTDDPYGLAQAVNGTAGTNAAADPDSQGSTGTSSGSGKVNINTADSSELMTLTGIGESKASAIIAYREENGSFSSIEDIKKVSGIKEAAYEKIKDQITV